MPGLASKPMSEGPLVASDTGPNGFHAVALAPCAADRELPSRVQRIAQCLDHRTKTNRSGGKSIGYGRPYGSHNMSRRKHPFYWHSAHSMEEMYVAESRSLPVAVIFPSKYKPLKL